LRQGEGKQSQFHLLIVVKRFGFEVEKAADLIP